MITVYANGGEAMLYFALKILIKIQYLRHNYKQCSGSGFSQVSGSVSGSRRAKMTHRHIKKLRNFMF
jgi:hypothetical protein